MILFIAFVILVLPFLWGMVLCARLGMLLKKRGFSNQLHSSDPRQLWSRLFECAPEAKPQLRKILTWIAGTALIVWPLGFIVIFILVRYGIIR